MAEASSCPRADLLGAALCVFHSILALHFSYYAHSVNNSAWLCSYTRRFQRKLAVYGVS